MNLLDEKLLAALLRREQQIEAQIASSNTSANFLLVLAAFIPAQISVLHAHVASLPGHVLESASIVSGVSAIAASVASVWPREVNVMDQDQLTQGASEARHWVSVQLPEATARQSTGLAGSRFTQLETSSAEERIIWNEKVLRRKNLALVVALWFTVAAATCFGLAALLSIRLPSQASRASAVAPEAAAAAPAAPQSAPSPQADAPSAPAAPPSRPPAARTPPSARSAAKPRPRHPAPAAKKTPPAKRRARSG